MKRVFILCTCLFFTLASLQGQIIFEEDFESGSMPAGWTVETNATDGGWNVGTVNTISSQYFGIQSNGSSYIAGTNDDACNCDKSNEYLITPPIDLSDQTAVVLSVDVWYTDNSYQGNNEDATIEISLDGETWEVLEDLHGHGSWDTHVIDLSAYAGEATVYLGFRYDDGGGWLYGFAMDNVVVDVPPLIDARLAELEGQVFGEVGNSLPIKGTFLNAGASTITEVEITYMVNGGDEVTEILDNLDVAPFSYSSFELSSPWMPDAAGEYTIDVSIVTVNGESDENPDDNSDVFDTEIFDAVTVPNKMADFLNTNAVISEVANASHSLDRPTDLDFFPILGKNEVWVVNQRTENEGGSTLTISDATADPSDFWLRVDGNAWHFMSLPTGIAFSDDNFNFATSPGVKDANHSGGTFTGPSLWSSDPEIYAQPSGGNGSHLDMLHGSPFSMGIAHEADNVFWVYDDWNKDIVRYDFVDDHGPGNDDHSDAIVRRYRNIGIDGDSNVPNHMVLDKETGWLYFVDNGNDRVIRLDINSGSVSNTLPLINEPLAEHSEVSGFTYEVIIDSGLDRPCGIELFENRLLVGDYATGDIVMYDMENGFTELGRIPTLLPGLTGIKVGPDGNIWYTNRMENTLSKAEPGETTSTTAVEESFFVELAPNPTSGALYLNFPDTDSEVMVTLISTTGQQLANLGDLRQNRHLNLSHLSDGMYFLQFKGEAFTVTKKVMVQK